MDPKDMMDNTHPAKMCSMVVPSASGLFIETFIATKKLSLKKRAFL
jgi:hypothetical protein